MNQLSVNGVQVDLDSDEIQAAKSHEDVEALGLFDHFNDNAKDESNSFLSGVLFDEKSNEPETTKDPSGDGAVIMGTTPAQKSE